MSVSTDLPVASPGALRRYVGSIARTHRTAFSLAVGLHVAAALFGLAAPRLMGDLVDQVRQGTTVGAVDRIALLLAGFLVAQTVLTRFARFRSQVLGEQVLAQLREDFVGRALRLPIGTVEAAGSGDLLTRASRDVDQLGWSVRWALPEFTIAVVTTVMTLAASVLLGWWVLLPLGLTIPPLVLITRWYLARAKAGYLAESASYSAISAVLTETAEGARTLEAFGQQDDQVARIDASLDNSYRAEKYTLMLRTRLFPVVQIVYTIPVVGTVLFGGWLALNGHVTLGAVTSAALYALMLVGPLDTLISLLDELQQGSASTARLLGVGEVPDDRTATGATPDGEKIDVQDARFAYGQRDVLHGIDLDLAVGERIAMVGPSGAGKSTLGRLLAGIHPPRTGAVTVGEVPLVDLPLGDLRTHVALVTQEHHVFAGTLRENLVLALPDSVLSAEAGFPAAAPAPDALQRHDEQILAALAAVDAQEWALALGLDTRVGSGGHALSAAQAQQVALARLVLVDPHTLVLDEATSLIDPRAARHLERSLAAVLQGRTVVAIAHRLFSAHDADRVAVVEDGRITEFGSHDDLLARGGSYAALWESWHGR